jgi:hypothetical protein
LVTSLSREDRILGSVKPFRLSTATEIATLRRVFSRISGLTTGQFAENGFGFPFIPYPEIDPTNPKKTKLSPGNTANRFLFHPIYWIDPRITAPTEAELRDPARWSIRMFYELLSFGLLNPETLQWLNPAVVKGVNYTPADIDSLMNDAASVLDTVVFGDQDRLPGYASSEVLDAADTALERIRAMQQREINRIGSLRETAKTDVEMILNQNDNWGGLYNTLQTIANNIDNARQTGMPISSYIDEIYSVKTQIARYLASADDAIMGLSYDLVDQVSFSNDAVMRFAALSALVKRGKGLISKAEATMDEAIAQIFSGSNGRAQHVVEVVSNMHADMIDRMSLAYRNDELAKRGNRVIRSVDERMFDETHRTQQASDSDFNF